MQLCSRHQGTGHIPTYLVLTAFYSAEIHSIQLLIYALHIYVSNIFLRKQVSAYLPKAKVPRAHRNHTFYHSAQDQGSSRRQWGCGRTDRPKLSWPVPQAGLVLVMHLPYGSYNLAAQNSGPAASVFPYNLYIQTKMNSNFRILHPCDRSAVTLLTAAAPTNLYQQQFYLQKLKINQVDL